MLRGHSICTHAVYVTQRFSKVVRAVDPNFFFLFLNSKLKKYFFFNFFIQLFSAAFLLEQTDVESVNKREFSLSNDSNRQPLRHSVSFNLSRDSTDNLNVTSERRARRHRTSVVDFNVDVGRLAEFNFGSTFKARDTVLRICGQSQPLEFEDIYSER